MSKKNNIVMFACNQGGHFSQMMALSELFGKYNSVLVTDNVRATKEMQALANVGNIEFSLSMAERRKELKGHKRTTSRKDVFTAYIKLFFECRRIWRKYRPKVIVSTGSNIAVPLFYIGKLHGSKLIFIETRAKVYTKSLTGKLVGKISDKIYVQWPEMLKVYPTAEYFGTLV